MAEKKPCLVRGAEIVARENSFFHPWNPESATFVTSLSRLVGLERAGVSLVRVPAEKESFVYHSHLREEEWIYILSGRGIAEIGDEAFEVTAGDFMGFTTPSAPHHLRNPNEEELVYLMGGENLEMEIVDFPRHGKRMVRHGEDIDIYNMSDAKELGPLEE